MVIVLRQWMIRLISCLFCAVIAVLFPLRVSADGLTVETQAAASWLPAKSAVLMDADSGQVLYEMEMHEQMPPASITKIMTMLLVMEAIDAGKLSYEDMVSCSEHAAGMGGSQIWLEPGEQMCVEDLLKAVAVNSANDAAVALGEHLAGSEEAFVEQMNRRAAELGMEDTVFRNASGLDEEGHLSSAYDIAVMSRELLKHPDILRFTTIWTDSIRNGETALSNTNRLVRFYEGCTGLKTGTTDGAGSCLSASAERDGVRLIAVSMGSSTSDERFESCRSLLDYGFSGFERYTPSVELPQAISVKGGTQGSLPLTVGEIPSILIPKGKAEEVSCTISIPEEVPAPVEAGEEIGRVNWALDGSLLAEVPVTAACGVPEMNFRSAFGLIWKMLLGG